MPNPFLTPAYIRKGNNNASIKQIKDGIIQSGILYRVIVWLDCVKYIKKMLTSTC